jgi:lipoprotein-anchoring transpeptidase ErfK/SrfK
VVNRKGVSVYQTDVVLILVEACKGASNGRAHGETVQSTSMSQRLSLALLAGASCLGAGLHQAQAIEVAPLPESTVVYVDQPAQRSVPVRTAYVGRSNLGGGFIEFLFGGGQSHGERYQQQPAYQQPGNQQQPLYQPQGPMLPGQFMHQQDEVNEPGQVAFDPKYEKQLVDYRGTESAGTIVIDTPNKFLFLVQGDGTALRYGIGVGRPGFTWSGVKQISAKKEWPAWTPPPEMLARRPDLPRHMEGGPENPLGARAMYLGSSLYRIHGSNEPWTIGTNVSSGCIRMRNEDVIDLYGRVNVGAKVIVI